jgi:eukaryotic-like serine/threonine-protein kinase
MNIPASNACSREHILQYLRDELASSEHQAFLEHLDTCSDCRQTMERLAGDDKVWDTVTLALQSTSHQQLARGEGYGRLPSGDAISSSASMSHNASETMQEPTVTRWELAWVSTWLGPSNDPKAMGKIGVFEALQVIGTGGTGVVFLAREPSLGREVAIKVLAPHMARMEVARQRFEREARATAGLVHENIIPIYQVSEWRGLPFLVMQYFPESSLETLLKRDGKISLDRALFLALQIAQGLEQAHAKEIIHRDIKPANILLANDAQRAILTDFGLAQAKDDLALTCSGILAGTPHFMSPEQARGEVVDERSDLYSLGCVLFAMVTGHSPLHTESESGAIRCIASGDIPSLREAASSAPNWLVAFVDSLLDPNKENRPANAETVVAWLSQSIAHLKDPNTNPTPAPILSSTSNDSRKSRMWYITRAVLVATGLLLLVGLLSQTWRLYSINRTDPETQRKMAEYIANNRMVHFCSEDVDSVYELVKVMVIRLNDRGEVEREYPVLVNVLLPCNVPVPPGTFYFVLPVNQQYTLKSTWRLRDNHRVDAQVVEAVDTFEWNRARHDRVTLLPPDQR